MSSPRLSKSPSSDRAIAVSGIRLLPVVHALFECSLQPKFIQAGRAKAPDDVAYDRVHMIDRLQNPGRARDGQGTVAVRVPLNCDPRPV